MHGSAQIITIFSIYTRRFCNDCFPDQNEKKMMLILIAGKVEYLEKKKEGNTSKYTQITIICM